MPERIALLGFLPWSDLERGVAVHENPAAVVAELCARELSAEFVPITVSDAGIHAAMERVAQLEPGIIVALGQTSTEPRVEMWGRTPRAGAPREPDESAPWLLALDAEVIAQALNRLTDPTALTEPFRESTDAGGYFCDQLCVELVRYSRRTLASARFLHITATDGCAPDVRDARLRQYVRQARETVEHLRRTALL